MSTEKKIEKFAEIIRGDGTRPIVLTDPKQREHPFESFVTNVKKLRDSIAHFSKRKEPIWLPPDTWRELAEDACDTCMEVARRFWDACYPGRGMPDYLGWLETERHAQLASDQLDAANDEVWRGQVPGDIGGPQK